MCVCVTAEKKVHSVGEIKRKFYYSFLLIAPYKASESKLVPHWRETVRKILTHGLEEGTVLSIEKHWVTYFE